MAQMADSVSALLDRLRRTDVMVTAEGDHLLLDGPNNALTADLVAEVRSRKQELLAALAARSSAFCVRDGCTAHSVLAKEVRKRWDEVRRRDLRPGHCACCGGPAQPWTLVCRWCELLTVERSEELTEALPCALCGGRSYTRAAPGWLCRGCWNEQR